MGTAKQREGGGAEGRAGEDQEATLGGGTELEVQTSDRSREGSRTDT